ncbi:MAG: B12-binding domain-containing radical SAM protein [Eubacteriales bacterium]|nr:B12-binding domain-containing radical SAM protein [Eubacteriales bacterium]
MKFLLVALNAKYIHSNPAIHSLRAYAALHSPEAAGEVELAEYTINQPLEEILADLYERKPDVIAFSCYIWNWRQIRELTACLHQVLPELPIWLGGPEVSYDAERILESRPFLTGIMVGEGEETFAELLGYYEKSSSGRYPRQFQLQIVAFWPGAVRQAGLDTIRGLVYRDPVSGRPVRTAPRELTDISRIPFFYGDMKEFEHRIVYYESSRGCPFRCSYCLSSIDKTVRLRDMELVKKELQFFLDRRVPQVKFIDRTFNCSHKHAKEIWSYLLEHDNGVTNFHFEISAELLDGEELALLGKMRPGLVQLEIGVQSTNPETLQAVRRSARLDRLRHAVVRIHAEHNVHVHLDLIAGLPFEDLKSFERSFNDVYSMRPEQLQLGFLKVLKGSRMEEMAESWGLVYRQEPPYEVLSTKWLSYGDVVRLKKVEEMVELYYNSGQFTHLLPVLEQRFEAPFDLYDRLARFYQEKGYFVNSPSRTQRYRVLLDFAESVDAERIGLYRELAVYDLYLRENLKSRPDFAADRRPWRERISAFYREEEEQRSYLAGYDRYQARQLERMTHLEIFRWPVDRPAWELRERTEAAEGEETAILFDYERRDPLTGNARTLRILLG